MKYMQDGGFQKNRLMQLTLLLTVVLLTAFWLSNFALYFAKMDLTPESVRDYYLGSEAEYKMPRTYQSMLEVTHSHLPMMALVILLLTHLLIFAPFAPGTKTAFIVSGFTLALLNESAGWLVRFVHPQFAVIKVAAFLLFQAILGFLLISLALFLIRSRKDSKNKNGYARQPRKETAIKEQI